EGLRAGLHAAGLGSAVVGTLGTFGAVIAGLAMTRGRTLGAGPERIHHLFVWPAVMFSTVLVAWRLLKRGRAHSLRFYLAGMSVASTLMLAAGYSGGEMLAAETGNNAFLRPDLQATDTVEPAPATAGRQLFLKNCAHCHGPDARGDEGPDLHKLDWTDQQITSQIRNGRKGQMPAFGGKLSSENISNIVAYVQSLK
ncbi:MAG TPA: cytochrome c, partial [Candidatus Dormibacteraeota bacterium]|nr:cytochrome c [Candidatus Dormibacteraeota bacterium]